VHFSITALFLVHENCIFQAWRTFGGKKASCHFKIFAGCYLPHLHGCSLGSFLVYSEGFVSIFGPFHLLEASTFSSGHV